MVDFPNEWDPETAMRMDEILVCRRLRPQMPLKRIYCPHRRLFTDSIAPRPSFDLLSRPLDYEISFYTPQKRRGEKQLILSACRRFRFSLFLRLPLEKNLVGLLLGGLKVFSLELVFISSQRELVCAAGIVHALEFHEELRPAIL